MDVEGFLRLGPGWKPASGGPRRNCIRRSWNGQVQLKVMPLLEFYGTLKSRCNLTKWKQVSTRSRACKRRWSTRQPPQSRSCSRRNTSQTQSSQLKWSWRQTWKWPSGRWKSSETKQNKTKEIGFFHGSSTQAGKFVLTATTSHGTRKLLFLWVAPTKRKTQTVAKATPRTISEMRLTENSITSLPRRS